MTTVPLLMTTPAMHACRRPGPFLIVILLGLLSRKYAACSRVLLQGGGGSQQGNQGNSGNQQGNGNGGHNNGSNGNNGNNNGNNNKVNKGKNGSNNGGSQEGKWMASPHSVLTCPP